MFDKSRWIWTDASNTTDTHADFIESLKSDPDRSYRIRLSCDSNYVLYVNGKIASFGQYADYPDYKVYDEKDITSFLIPGLNRLSVTVWYYGVPSSTYAIGKAGLIYEIEDDLGTIVAYSSSDTLSRYSPYYEQHYGKLISGQLGLTFFRDESRFDSFTVTGSDPGKLGFSPSHVLDEQIPVNVKRPIKNLVLRDRIESTVISQGVFKYNTDRDPGPKMQHAGLSFHFITNMDPDSGFNPVFRPDARPLELSFPNYVEPDDFDGIYLIADLGAEDSGFAELEIEVDENTDIEVGWGEHLLDGRCRTAVVNAWCRFRAPAGRSVCMDPFRRMGCRYVQFFIHARKARVHYAGLRPTDYPLNVREFRCGNILRETIYRVCVNTLVKCMHEHYEDCPWREQALYTLDSRNQMLCGYYSFGETEFARASLKLISRGVQEDGLLDICYPASEDIVIPSYTCAYFIQMAEYIRYSSDTSLADEVFGILESLLETFTKRIDENGLVPRFTGKKRFWNFYEWSPTLMGNIDGESDSATDSLLNSFLILACDSMSYICERLGKTVKAQEYRDVSLKLSKDLFMEFFDSGLGLFRTRKDSTDTFSVLANSLCMLALKDKGIVFEKSAILELLSTNGKTSLPVKTIPNTLSMNGFRFDALLAEDRDRYRDIILDEIDRVYFRMLRNGATSFWETASGDNDIIGIAGSLCHGWSALPIYYYEILLDDVK